MSVTALNNNSGNNLGGNHKRRKSRLGGARSEDFKIVFSTLAQHQNQLQHIQTSLHRTHSQRMCQIFNQWIENTHLRKKQEAFDLIKAHGDFLHSVKIKSTIRRLATFTDGCNRIVNKHQSHNLFLHWYEQVQRVKSGERNRNWLRYKIQLWMDRAVPGLSMNKYIERWKAFTIFSYRSQGNRNGHEDAQDPNMPKFDYQKLMGRNFTVENLKQMALDDLHARWALEEKTNREEEKWSDMMTKMQNQLNDFKVALDAENVQKHGELSAKVVVLEKETKVTKRELKLLISNSQESERAQLARSESNQQHLMGELGQFKTQITAKVGFVKDALDEAHDKLDNLVRQEVLTRVSKVETLVEVKARDFHKTLHEKAHEIAQRIDRILKHNESQDASLSDHLRKIEHNRRDIILIQQVLQDHQQNIAKTNTNIKELSAFYDEEINWLKNIAKESARSVTEFKKTYETYVQETQVTLTALGSEEGSNERYQKLQTSVSTLLVKVDKWFDKAALVSLQYPHDQHKDSTNPASSNTAPEKPASSTRDPFHHLFQRVRGELAAGLGKSARRCAQFIALKTEEDLLIYYLQRHILRHRHDAFYDQTHHHQQPNPVHSHTLAHTLANLTPANIATKIEALRHEYLLKLERELEDTFELSSAQPNFVSGNNSTTSGRPQIADASNSRRYQQEQQHVAKVLMTTSAGLSMTPVEKQIRQRWIVQQFLSTVRQCLLAYPAVTTIAGLDSVLRTRSLNLSSSHPWPTVFSPQKSLAAMKLIHNPTRPLSPTLQSYHNNASNHDIVRGNGGSSHQTATDTCMACRRPLLDLATGAHALSSAHADHQQTHPRTHNHEGDSHAHSRATSPPTAVVNSGLILSRPASPIPPVHPLVQQQQQHHKLLLSRQNTAASSQLHLMSPSDTHRSVPGVAVPVTPGSHGARGGYKVLQMSRSASLVGLSHNVNATAPAASTGAIMHTTDHGNASEVGQIVHFNPSSPPAQTIHTQPYNLSTHIAASNGEHFESPSARAQTLLTVKRQLSKRGARPFSAPLTHMSSSLVQPAEAIVVQSSQLNRIHSQSHHKESVFFTNDRHDPYQQHIQHHPDGTVDLSTSATGVIVVSEQDRQLLFHIAQHPLWTWLLSGSSSKHPTHQTSRHNQPPNPFQQQLHLQQRHSLSNLHSPDVHHNGHHHADDTATMISARSHSPHPPQLETGYVVNVAGVVVSLALLYLTFALHQQHQLLLPTDLHPQPEGMTIESSYSDSNDAEDEDGIEGAVEQQGPVETAGVRQIGSMESGNKGEDEELPYRQSSAQSSVPASSPTLSLLHHHSRSTTVEANEDDAEMVLINNTLHNVHPSIDSSQIDDDGDVHEDLNGRNTALTNSISLAELSGPDSHQAQTDDDDSFVVFGGSRERSALSPSVPVYPPPHTQHARRSGVNSPSVHFADTVEEFR